MLDLLTKNDELKEFMCCILQFRAAPISASVAVNNLTQTNK